MTLLTPQHIAILEENIAVALYDLGLLYLNPIKSERTAIKRKLERDIARWVDRLAHPNKNDPDFK